MYKFTSKEYSDYLGITASALRKRRLKGKLEGLYKVIDGKFMYAAPRPNKENGTGIGQGFVVKKRRRNVPRHRTQYKSTAFALANDLKQLARIKKLLNENELEEITPEIFDVAKERRQKRLQKQLEPCPTDNNKYGQGLYNPLKSYGNYKRIKYSDEIEDEEREFWRR